MAEFRTSTQATFWQLTRSQLSARRQASQELSLSLHPSSNHAILLTPIEQATLLTHHAGSLSLLATHLSLSPKLHLTAQTYYKRFFVDTTPNEFHPAPIALLSLYAAAKVEEHPLSAEHLSAAASSILPHDPPATEALLLAAELPFLSKLRFHLIVYHPFRSLGILHELLRRSSAEGDAVGRLVARAERVVGRRSTLCDAMLVAPPGVVAIAAVVVAVREGGGEGVSEGDVLAYVETAKESDAALTKGTRTEVLEVAAELGSVREEGIGGKEEVERVVSKRLALGTIRTFLSGAVEGVERGLAEEDREENEILARVRGKRRMDGSTEDGGKRARVEKVL